MGVKDRGDKAMGVNSIAFLKKEEINECGVSSNRVDRMGKRGGCTETGP